MLNILFCCSTVLYADRYMFQEVQGILCSPTNWYSSPREPRLGKQLQLQLGVERDCPYLLLWGIKLNTKNTLIVCLPLGRRRETRSIRELRGFKGASTRGFES